MCATMFQTKSVSFCITLCRLMLYVKLDNFTSPIITSSNRKICLKKLNENGWKESVG